MTVFILLRSIFVLSKLVIIIPSSLNYNSYSIRILHIAQSILIFNIAPSDTECKRPFAPQHDLLYASDSLHLVSDTIFSILHTWHHQNSALTSLTCPTRRFCCCRYCIRFYFNPDRVVLFIVNLFTMTITPPASRHAFQSSFYVVILTIHFLYDKPLVHSLDFTPLTT